MTGCSVSMPGSADETGTADVTQKPVNADVKGEPEAYHEAVNALGDDYPKMSWNEPLPSDVTEAELQEWLDEGRLPIGEAHGGFFETMANALAATEEAPDVVFLGDSMTQQGIDPQVVEKELSDSTGQEVTAFNAASSRARWGVNRMVAEYMVKIDRVPDVAVLMLSTRATENDLFYKTDVAKAPFSSVVQGCDRERGKHWTAADEAQCRKDVQDLTVRYREAGGQVARAEAGKMAVTSGRVDKDSVLRSDGMMIHGSMTAEEVQKASDERTARGFPGFPHVTDDAVEDFRATKKILEAHGATVIASEIPYSPPHQENLEKFKDYDKRRMDSAEELAQRAGVPLFPVKSYGDWWGDHDSRDAIHLAPQGAAAFTEQLLDDIPGFRDAVEEGLDG